MFAAGFWALGSRDFVRIFNVFSCVYFIDKYQTECFKCSYRLVIFHQKVKLYFFEILHFQLPLITYDHFIQPSSSSN